ncbi:MAG TPA: hypothetical protein VLE53_08825 [Gemmatimonadaceae bacterium]|nr:hypothetical protein [Gemmatimonadaceae bacterium]
MQTFRAPLSLASIALIAVTGCSSLHGLLSRPVVREATVPVRRAAPAREDFKAQLVAVAPGVLNDSERETWPLPTARVHLQLTEDETFEYQVRIKNAVGVTYVSGQLHRRLPDGSNELVATLFSDVALSGPSVQLRGTASVARGVPAAEICDALRSSPESFIVQIDPQAGQRGQLHGVLR